MYIHIQQRESTKGEYTHRSEGIYYDSTESTYSAVRVPAGSVPAEYTLYMIQPRHTDYTHTLCTL